MVHPLLYQLGVHRTCIHNEVRSADKRVLGHQHRELQKQAIELLDRAGEELAEEIGPVIAMSYDDLLRMSPPGKKKVYARAIENVRVTGYQKWHARINAFVKVEKLNFTNKDPDPRMIQARSTEFNVQLGRYSRAIEHRLYNLREYGIRLLAKGRNSRQRAKDLLLKWDSLVDPVALSLDLSRWDMHCSPDQLRATHRVYLKCLPAQEFAFLLEATVRNKARTTNGLEYVREGNVMSGDMTTALGNCLMVLQMVRAFQIKNESWLPRSAVRVYDDGDDHLILVEREYATTVAQMLPEWYQELGHKLVVEGITDNVQHVEFCQQRLVNHAYGWEFVPNPAKALATSLSYVMRPCAPQYLGTVWEMRAILHQGQPVLGPLFDRIAKENPKRLRSKGTQLVSLDIRLKHDGRREVYGNDITLEHRMSYERAWGWNVDTQLMFENLDIQELLTPHGYQYGTQDFQTAV